MGKSTASCFKIMACGSDSVDHDDIQAPAENKGSSGRGWSFRKRSARHRVLSNTVNSETPSGIKESPESAAVNFQPHLDSTLPEKASVVQWTEVKTEAPSLFAPKVSDQKDAGEDDKRENLTTEVPVQLDPKVSDQKAAGGGDETENSTTEVSSQLDPNISDQKTAVDDDQTENATIDESSIIVIQAAVKGWMARKALLKQKNIIKLQAAVRGHLVRSHAVGTLRCVQAIIKMQALVRARRVRLLEEGSGDLEEHTERNGKELLKKKEGTKPTYAYISLEQLLSNSFARQLLESTPRTKPIYIKCDPLKSDSAWKWLERWMSVSPASCAEKQEPKTNAELQDKDDLGHLDSKKEILVSSDRFPEMTNIKSVVVTSAQASEIDDNMITYETNSLDLPAFQSIKPPSSCIDVQKIEESNLTNDIPESASDEIKEPESFMKVEAESPQDKEETEEKQDIPDFKKTSIEQAESEAKKNLRKASNPSFIAAQSKFEELSLSTTSAKLTNSVNLDPRVESTLEKASFDDQTVRTSEVGLVENSISHASAVQVGGSECGTELSISSTLDSPDISEVGINELEQNLKISNETINSRTTETVVLEENGTSSEAGIGPSYNVTDHLERDETANLAFEESVSSVVAADSSQLEKKPEADPSDVHLELVSEASHVAYKSSPEASPRSHITVPESQATPSSQASVKPKKSRGDRTDCKRKNRSASADKKSASNRNRDSASSSVEQLPEHKTGKRRNSFGSAKPDHGDQEPRDSSSSISLPSYMQATESAKAKAITNGSPRSSPDVHEKDIHLKKRHSLPGTNGRQGSPRIQRSLSQAQQNIKGNGTQSPQERQWRR